MKYGFYLGSYAAAEEDSIYKYELDTEGGSLRRENAVKGVENPSYILLHPNGKMMYVVEESVTKGRIAVYERNKGAEYLFSLPSEGADPCHLGLNDKGDFLFVSNYTSGSFSAFRLDSDGKPMVCTDCRQHRGCGMNPERQEGPHVHFSGMVDEVVYTCDLGLDCLVSYRLDRKTGKLSEAERNIQLPGGFGPRHFAMHNAHRGFIYVVGELTGEVIVLKKNGDGYEAIQKISSLPEFFEAENTAAAIKFNEEGKLLFVSNRGSDSITSFIVRDDGLLRKGDICSSGGKGPRDFEIFGETIVAANQYSDNLAIIKYAEDTGKMQLITNSEMVSKPVMICALK